jgi:hypothetical protein
MSDYTLRLGIIKCSLILYETHKPALQAIFSKLIPIAVEFDESAEVFIIKAFSLSFRVIEEGAAIPTYKALITQEQASPDTPNNGFDYFARFEEIE